MTLDLLARITAVVAVLGTAVVYGTDVFCALVLRPALAALDDRVLVAVTGKVHRFGDRRMPVPGVLGIAASAASAALAAAASHWWQAAAAGAAFLLLLVWLAIYVRISAPVNRALTAASDDGRSLPDGRALQARWDRVINARATAQGLAVAGLCVALLA